MLFKRKLPLNEVREAFRKKLIVDGLPPVKARKTANMMSKADIEQVHKDLNRHTKLVIIDKKTGVTREYSATDINTTAKARGFLRKIAGENASLYDYLSQYFHQGGFMNLSEILMYYYFMPDTLIEMDNKRGIFTIEKDGSVTFEEKFDITRVKDLSNGVTFEVPDNKPIATISFQSNMKEEKGQVVHKCREVKVKAHDKVAEKYFEDPRSKFSKFMTWIKDSIVTLFNRFEREQEHKRQAIFQPKIKL